MDEKTFNTFREIIYDKSGIAINPNKVALVTARVGKRLRELGIPDHESYLEHLLNDESGDEFIHLLDVISTNVTNFFRESEHFDLVGDLFTEWLNKGQKRFRFWSAASSTGEEPYTLAMTLLEKLSGASADIKILATDISTRALQKATDGSFREDKVGQIPSHLLKKYFTAEEKNGYCYFTVKKVLRDMVTFSRLNLSKTPFPMNGPMDVIFCRNVMIYFDNNVRKSLLNELYRLLKPGGYLCVGHAESLTGLLSGFKAVKPSVYIK